MTNFTKLCSHFRFAVVSLSIAVLLMSVSTQRVCAQSKDETITSYVVDDKGQPIIGATVIVKETPSVGLVTDINGKFSITTRPDYTLVVSYIGYTTKEVMASVANGRKVDLKDDAQSLSEVVVIAYGVQKKVTITGAVSSIGDKDLLNTPVASLGNALAGKVTGLSSIQYSGAPGADDPSIFVRGVGSLSDDRSKPLILVDGVERGFTQIDPNEIADITILKDASATAVFGVRGANGVILITSKRGTQGAAKVSLSSSFGLQVPTDLMAFSNSYDYATYYNEAQRNDGVAPAGWKFKPDVLEAFRTHSNPLVYPDIKWLDYMLKKSAPQTQHNINISGGTDKVKYFVSLGYLNQQGLFKTYDTDKKNNFNYNRYNYRANIDVDVTKSTRMAINLGGRVEDRNTPADGEESLFRYIQASTPFGGAGIVDGKRIITNKEYIVEPGRDGLDKVYGRGYATDSRNVLNLDLSLNQRLDFWVKGLSVNVKGSYNNYFSHEKKRGASVPSYTPVIEEDGVFLQKNGDESLMNYSEEYGSGRDWYAEANISYNRKFGKHNVTALALYNQSKKYYPSSFPDIPNGYVGLVGRVTYDYDTKYLVDFNAGYNGSENFAVGKRYGFFPSGSVGWVVTNEKFMSKQKVITYLKIRGSYGLVGNDNIGGSRFYFLPNAWNYTNYEKDKNEENKFGYNFGTDVSAYYRLALEGKIGNPDLTWETAYKQNYGIDMAFLRDRLSLNVDYFYELRKGLLVAPESVPGILGAAAPLKNIGEVVNWGCEVNLKWSDKLDNGLRYTINPSLTYNRNKILQRDEVRPNFPYMARTGQSVGQFFGYEYFGLYQGAETDALYQQTYGKPIPEHIRPLEPGDCVYVDLSGDGKITSDDVHKIGYSDLPRLSASLNYSFSYKGFDMSMLWTGATMVSRRLDRLFRPVMTAQHNESMLQWSFDNRWTEATRRTATLPRASFSAEGQNTYDSRLWIVDASYIRLRNVELGYTFSPTALKKVGISSLRVYATGFNLLTFTKDYPGGDPEQKRDDLDKMKYPLTKVFNLGLNVTF